ncbi:MAG: ABC transporter ATP-binding protein [Kiloniellaceae bacterium]
MSVLELQGLSRSYGGIVAADSIDLSLEASELHCLIGPNGAGKSTVFKLIVGLVKPQSGHILLNGRDITRVQPYQRARLGISMKYQTTRIFMNLTVGQNITIARSREAFDGDHLDWALTHLDLGRRWDDPVSTLSYGEQHWLEMCMALGNRPCLVLMDEPTAGMTPDETGKTARLLKQLNARGPTIVVIEHDMSFVREIAQRVTVLHQGKIFRQGSISEIETDRDVQRIYLGERHD